MKILLIFIFLICLAFQACDAGSKKQEAQVSLPKSKDISTSILAHTEKTNIVSETENKSDSTNQLKTTSNSNAWKKEVSKGLKPKPLASSASHTISSSGIREKVSAKDTHKKELTMSDKSDRINSVDPTKELDLSEENNFGKRKKAELQEN